MSDGYQTQPVPVPWYLRPVIKVVQAGIANTPVFIHAKR